MIAQSVTRRFSIENSEVAELFTLHHHHSRESSVNQSSPVDPLYQTRQAYSSPLSGVV